MPATPYAKLLASVNAAPPTSGGILVSNGDVIQLSGENTSGWVLRKYEIYSFYSTSEFPLPSGWTNDGNGVYSYSLGDTPPPFTLPALPAWGKWLLRLTVNNGLNRDGAVDPTLKDESTALSVQGPGGLLDLAHLESLQFSTLKKWVGDLQANLRFIDQLLEANLSPTFATAGTLSAVDAGDTAVGGVSPTIARGDHQHAVSTGTPGGLSIGASAAEGVATTLARSDHTHSIAAPSAPANVTKAAASAGVASTIARSDHKHDVTTAAAGTAAIGDAAAEGSASSLARSDHAHAFPAPAAPANVTKAAASAGAATTFARADHKHDVTTAVAGAIAIGDAAAEGSSSSLARADHVHSVAAPAAPAQVDKSAASAGAATTFARADHKHDINTATPVSIGTANSEGSSVALARADHVHAPGSVGATNHTWGNGSVPVSGNSFLTPGYDGAAATTGEIKWTVDKAFTATGMRYRARVGGSGAPTIDIKLLKNGSASGFGINALASTATTGSATGSVSFAAGDDISIQFSPSGTLDTSPNGIVVTVGVTT